MNDVEALVAVFNSHAAAEDAVRRLQRSGFDVTRLSIVTESDSMVERVAGFYTTEERVRSWSATGAICGGALGLLAGTALIMIPGIEAGAVGDAVLPWLSSAVGAAVAIGGLSALGAGAYSAMLPKDGVLKYESELSPNDKYLLMASGPAPEAAAVRDTLWAGIPLESEVYWREGEPPGLQISSHTVTGTILAYASVAIQETAGR